MANITFMIGNGFDLGFKLNTSYEHFYKSLNPNQNNKIIKNILEKRDGFDNLWSNMELGLGDMLAQYSDDNAASFIDDKIELEDYLTIYLKKQEQRFQIIDKDKVASSFTERLLSIESHLPQKFKGPFNQIVKTISEPIYYSFINFNYTNTLDLIINTLPENTPISSHAFIHNGKASDYVTKPLHIHGGLENMMVLGVNDKSQINNADLQNHEDIVSSMVKSKANDEVGNNNTQEAKKIINNSRIIYVYGLSLGATDKMWTQLLFDWLNRSPNGLLIIDLHDINYNTNSTSRIIKSHNQALNRIVANNDISRDLLASVRNRLCFVTNTNLFKIDGIAILDE